MYKVWQTIIISFGKVMNTKLQCMQETFFSTKKFMKHQVQYHVLNSKKSDLFVKDKIQNIEHEQNVEKNLSERHFSTRRKILS